MAALATTKALDAMTALIESEDYIYEERVAREPYAVNTWLQYIRFKTNLQRPSPAVINLLYERALSKTPMSYKLWHSYLTARM